MALGAQRGTESPVGLDGEAWGFMTRITDEDALSAASAIAEYGSERKAAKALGVVQSCVHKRAKIAAERGLMGTKPVLPGFALTKTTAVTDRDGAVVREFIQQRPEHGEAFAIPEGHKAHGVSALVDSDGRIIQQWIKTKEQPTVHDAIAALHGAFDDVKPAKPTKPPRIAGASDYISLTPCNDWHIGMFSWGKENPQTGLDTNWDLKIAERVIGDTVDAVVDQSKPSKVAVVLGGGDLFHADNKENKTARSGNVLDVDGRYQKIMHIACRLKVRTIDKHLERHDNIIVRILRGNHDEHSAVAVAYYLQAYYRNEPRVVVDLDPSLFWFYRFDRVMLGATHGHTVKLQEMPLIMANRKPEDWGASRHRYVHGFHIHHKSLYAIEGGGCIMESHQAPIPPDSWHYGEGYITGQSIQSIRYHRLVGEKGRVREPIILLPEAANDNQRLRQAA